MLNKVRRIIIDKVEDDRLARDLLLEIQLLELTVSDREDKLKERLDKLEAQLKRGE